MRDLNQAYEDSNINQSNMAGKRMYPPWVLAGYSIIANIPLAVFLYGINVHRRGNTVLGNMIKAVAGLAIVVMTASAIMMESRIKGIPLMLLGLVVGIGLARAETRSYRRSILSGAIAARWWPPLLFVLGQLAVILALVYILDIE